MQAARQVDDKECYSSYTTNGGGAGGNGRLQRKSPAASLLKPMPSKWDDAQKWLVGMSNGGGGGGGGGDGSVYGGKAARPRNSNADDRRLLSSASQNGRVSCSSVDGGLEYNMVVALAPPTPPQLGECDDVGETKNMVPQRRHGSPDVEEAFRSVCLRDMGTEMTPIASKEPSRAATPLRASTPAALSPMSSRPSTPARRPWQDERPHVGVAVAAAADAARTDEQVAAGKTIDSAGEADGGGGVDSHAPPRAISSLESRAAAWDEAERAKFTARYKREEVKLQAWENRERRKAEMEMKKTEMKAEQMKARAQERLANKLAAARRVAEEKRAAAESTLNECAARTSEKAEYIRRTGHLPSSFFSSFRIPSLCG